jgi:hypothetical protein
MDIGFLFYMGFISLCIICFPPVLTIIATAMIFALGKMNIISVSNRQVLAIGAILLFVCFVATCLIAQYASKDVYAM